MLAVPFLRSTRTRSPVFSSASPPPAAASGEALRIEGEPEVPGLAAVADAGQRMDAALDEIGRRLHVDDLGAAGIADRPGAAHEQHGMFVDVHRRIVDAGDGSPRARRTPSPALEGFRDRWDPTDSGRGIPAEITLVFMIALSNRLPLRLMKPACCFNGSDDGADHLAVEILGRLAIVAERSCRSPSARRDWAAGSPCISSATTAGTPPAW